MAIVDFRRGMLFGMLMFSIFAFHSSHAKEEIVKIVYQQGYSRGSGHVLGMFLPSTTSRYYICSHVRGGYIDRHMGLGRPKLEKPPTFWVYTTDGNFSLSAGR